MQKRRLLLAITLPWVLLILATPFADERLRSDKKGPGYDYSVRLLGGLFWVPSRPYYATLREQDVVDGRTVWRTAYVAGPRISWSAAGIIGLLAAAGVWFADGLAAKSKRLLKLNRASAPTAGLPDSQSSEAVSPIPGPFQHELEELTPSADDYRVPEVPVPKGSPGTYQSFFEPSSRGIHTSCFSSQSLLLS